MKTIVIMLLVAASVMLTGCVTEQGSATPGYWKASSNLDPEARFGLLIEVNPIVVAPESESK